MIRSIEKTIPLFCAFYLEKERKQIWKIFEQRKFYAIACWPLALTPLYDPQLSSPFLDHTRRPIHPFFSYQLDPS